MQGLVKRCTDDVHLGRACSSFFETRLACRCTIWHKRVDACRVMHGGGCSLREVMYTPLTLRYIHSTWEHTRECPLKCWPTSTVFDTSPRRLTSFKGSGPQQWGDRCASKWLAELPVSRTYSPGLAYCNAALHSSGVKFLPLAQSQITRPRVEVTAWHSVCEPRCHPQLSPVFAARQAAVGWEPTTGSHLECTCCCSRPPGICW